MCIGQPCGQLYVTKVFPNIAYSCNTSMTSKLRRPWKNGARAGVFQLHPIIPGVKQGNVLSLKLFSATLEWALHGGKDVAKEQFVAVGRTGLLPTAEKNCNLDQRSTTASYVCDKGFDSTRLPTYQPYVPSDVEAIGLHKQICPSLLRIRFLTMVLSQLQKSHFDPEYSRCDEYRATPTTNLYPKVVPRWNGVISEMQHHVSKNDVCILCGGD